MSEPTVDVREVSFFGVRRPARITKNRCNWKVEWIGSNVETFVPLRMAICATDAAMQAARSVEACKWGHRVLMAAIRGFVTDDGGLSTEFAKWINAKAEGRPYDRHEMVPAGLAVAAARAAIAHPESRRHV